MELSALESTQTLKTTPSLYSRQGPHTLVLVQITKLHQRWTEKMLGKLKAITKATTSISVQAAKNPKRITILLRSNQESCSRPKSRKIVIHKPRPKSSLLRLNTLDLRRKQAQIEAQAGRNRFKPQAEPRSSTCISITR